MVIACLILASIGLSMMVLILISCLAIAKQSDEQEEILWQSMVDAKQK